MRTKTMPKSKRPQHPARPDKPPQTIRGGFIVVRRQERTGRLLTMHGTAYEHPSSEAAKAQAAILAERFGCEFAVFCEIDAALPPSPLAVASEVSTSVVPLTDPVEQPSKGRRRGTLTLPKASASS
jgi:hypothetical protein